MKSNDIESLSVLEDRKAMTCVCPLNIIVRVKAWTNNAAVGDDALGGDGTVRVRWRKVSTSMLT